MNFLMSIISLPFGCIMWLCYSIVDNYALTIILFTLLTKLILFPISLKVQKNSIKMVKITPILNAISMRYAGDKDKIADEQLKAYEEEKYSPAIGCLPTLTQIPIVLGLINVIYNPLRHLLRLEQNVIDALINKATELLGAESLGRSAQMKVIDMVQSGQYSKEFETLTNVSNLNGVITKMQGVNTEFLGFHLSAVPTVTSLSNLIIIPALAGLSAFILCIVQNRENVLQMEQNLKSKYGMTIFMVAFSVYFTFIVPAGVGLYWICSNLLSIVTLYILNMIYSPKKYIDYEAKAKSEAYFQKQKEIKKKCFEKDKQNKQREKADYKRFFSTHDKQLVFYSEKSGFYKYFENVINEILKNSDILIHYVTSDPDDLIFKKNEPNIIAFYIGEKRLIPFMMKMDGAMVVMTMPDLDNFHIKRSYVKKDIEYIYMYHGVTNSHMVARKGCLDHYDTIFCVGPHQVEEIRETEMLYNLPAKRLIHCGYGLIEKIAKEFEESHKTPNAKKNILIAPSWQKDNILDSCVDELLSNLIDKGYSIIVRPHPEYIKRFGAKMDALLEKYSDKINNDFKIETDFTSNETVYSADLLITDWSTIAFEYSYATKKPTLFINTPIKVLNQDYAKYKLVPLDITLRKEIGMDLDLNNLSSIQEKAMFLFDHEKEYKNRISTIVEKYVYNFGESGKIGAKYIIDNLKKCDTIKK